MTELDCDRAREELHALRRGWLEPARAAAVQAHLASCESCRREEETERALDRALTERLPAPTAPVALRRRVELLAEAARPRDAQPPARARSLARLRRLAAPAAVAALALVTAGLLVERRARGGAAGGEVLIDELVTDHLRQLVAAHPHDVESSDKHEVKPWFEGRLDFAPAVPPDGGELRLLGGAVGYVLERKAAVVSYALRRHRVTLIAVPLAGLEWPGRAGDAPPRTTSRRGFSVFTWRSGELGYALVSDANPDELGALAARMAADTR